MSFYGRYLLPYLVHLGMRTRVATEDRARVVPQAEGIVLELGIGSALNVPYYGSTVSRVVGIDPSMELWRLGVRRAKTSRVPVRLVLGSAECVPLRDRSVDTVVCTWTLCSISDPSRALAEVRRVLKPGGRLLFVEHGAAPDARVRAWQQRLTPWWRRVAGNCHLDRAVDRLVADAGLRLVELERRRVRAPALLAYFYRGVATTDANDTRLPRNASPAPPSSGAPSRAG
ncbi:MAG TPA: class I SAM-dependent methyltransferase [Candidatus Tectomicrobia bacterium]|nr:class I SAM-dependent methyltransferase [Candidatus Tectomicrobia bacterium]